jgi:uncharacterized protein YkwD
LSGAKTRFDTRGMHASVARDPSPAPPSSRVSCPAEPQADASPAYSPCEPRSLGRTAAFGLFSGLALLGLLTLVLGPDRAVPPFATDTGPDQQARANTEPNGLAPGDGLTASRSIGRPAAPEQTPHQAAPLQTPADRPALDLPSPEALVAINRVRAQPQLCGAQWMPAVDPVRWNPQATQAAQNQAQYLQRSNRFGHAGEQGSHVGQRLAATGLRWRKAGENLAAGQDDLSEVLANWLASPSHCRVLMTAEFDLAGLAHVPGHDRNT